MTSKAFYDNFYSDGHHEGWKEAPGKIVILDFLKTLPTPNSILDIGCGEGFLLNEIYKIHQNTKFLLGIDISDIAIQKAKSLYSYSFLSTPIENFNNDNKFELIVSYGVFEHIKDPKDAVIKLKEHLAPNGYFALLMPTINYYRTDRYDEGFYEDLNNPPQLQWHWPRHKWEKLFSDNSLSLFDINFSKQFGAKKPGNFYFGCNR